MRTAALTLLLAAVATAAQAAGHVEVAGAWTRPAAAGGSAAGYMTLRNPGPADALVGAESPAAARVELHASSIAGGVMRMTSEAETPLPARGETRFAPGGRHLMFVGLKRPLKLGERLPATLRFRSGAKVAVAFEVRAEAPGGHMDMPGMR